MMRNPLSRNSRRARAFTLAEALVAMAGMTIIGGVVFGIWSETQGATKKLLGRQAAVDYAVFTIDQTAEMLRDAVHPENLQTAAVEQISFTSETLTIPSFTDDVSEGLRLLTIAPAEDEEARHAYVVQERALDSGEVIETRPLGLVTEQQSFVTKDFQPAISFSYATDVAPGQPIEFSPSLAPGQWPALVGITVTVVEPDNPEHPIVLETAVVPSRLSGKRSAAAPAASAPQQGLQGLVDQARRQQAARQPQQQAPARQQESAPAAPAPEAQ